MTTSAYTDNFGQQWNAFRRTQLDSVTGLTLSRDRFYKGTKWPNDLRGDTGPRGRLRRGAVYGNSARNRRDGGVRR